MGVKQCNHTTYPEGRELELSGIGTTDLSSNRSFVLSTISYLGIHPPLDNQ